MSKFNEILQQIDEMTTSILTTPSSEPINQPISGEHGNDIESSDWYATGDSRIPSHIIKKRKKYKKNKKDPRI